MFSLSWAFVSALQMIPAPPPPTIGQIHRGGIGQKKQQQQYRQSGRFLSVSFNEDNTAVSLWSLIISMHLCCPVQMQERPPQNECSKSVLMHSGRRARAVSAIRDS